MKKPRLAPYRRVATLSVSLLVLMSSIVGLGVLGVAEMRSDFDRLTQEDFPRFDHLLHIDRDLFRAQRALEDAMLEIDVEARSEALAEYRNQLERTASRWDSYLTVTAGEPQELVWQAEHDVARSAWLDSSDRLAVALETGIPVGTASMRELLHETQADFLVLRDVVHDLEEEVAEPYIEASIENVTAEAESTTGELVGLLIFGVVIGGLISITTYRAARLEYRQGQRREDDQRREAGRAAFEAELAQTLDMAQGEDSAIGAVSMVLTDEVPDRSAELLLADSSHAHLSQVAVSPEGGAGPGCGVLEPADCPAVRRGTSMEFTDSEAYSSCPHLRRRSADPCSAFCVPVSVAGRTAGVLHSTGERGQRIDADVAYKLEEVADRAGDRIGVLRAFAQSQTQAATDPLTGLHNRRSFENEISRRLRFGGKLAIAYGDLDHFKTLNDKHGHDAGDRALRLFSRVVKDTVREEDMAARWGGEEFVIAFDGLDAVAGAEALERLRANLVVALAGSNSAPFTVSFGICDTGMSGDLEELINLADESLLEAKERGRDRVLVAGDWSPAPAPIGQAEFS